MALRNCAARHRALQFAVAVAVGSVVVAGCSSSKSSGSAAGSNKTTSTNQAKQHPRIAFLELTLNNPYVQDAKNAAQAAATARGASITAFSANSTPATQLTQIQDIVSGGKFDALVLEPADGVGECKAILDAAKKLPVLIFNAPVCGNSGYTSGTRGYFGPDLAKNFRDIADIAVAQAKGGDIGYVSGPTNLTLASTTLKAFKSELAAKHLGAKLVTVVQQQYTDTGMASTQAIVTAHPGVKTLVYGYGYWMDTGLSALGNRSAVAYVGVKGETEKTLSSRPNTAVVIHPPKPEAVAATIAAIQIVKGQPLSVPGLVGNTWSLANVPAYSGNPTLEVTGANLAKYPDAF